MEKEVVSLEVARKEIERWLDFKRIPSRKRTEMSETIGTLVEGVVQGVLVIEEDFKITHKLIFPIESEGGENTVEVITYQPRLRARDINVRVQGVKVTETHALLLAYASALTNLPAQLLGFLDTEDLRISHSIASFFF